MSGLRERSTETRVGISKNFMLLEHYIYFFLSDCLVFFLRGFVWKRGKLYLFLDAFFVHFLFFFFKNSSVMQVSSMVDMVAVDFPANVNNRFSVTYSFISYPLNFRVFLKIFFPAFSFIHSSSYFFLSGGWLERELWDLFGIQFFLHPDLKRILTDYGFYGHPLRKDFPLVGFVEVRYDEVYKSIVIEPVELMQKYRYFKFDNP